MQSFKEILELSIPLFLIMDPFANSTACIAILKDYQSTVQRKIILREMVIALGIMILFQFFGSFLLGLLSIDNSTLRIAGGIILFIISLKLIFPEDMGTISQYEKDPFIVPIATPFIAGPSLLAAIMLYSKKVSSQIELFVAVFIAWASSLIIMLFFTKLKYILKQRGAKAIERLMGLILVLLAVQMLEQGIRYFLDTLK